MEYTLRNTIERFVREDLGCQCPAAVFRRVGVEACPGEFGDWPHGRLISVGDRLLILVLHCNDPAAVRCRLGALLREGRRLREARGFNRFRLVIAMHVTAQTASSLLQDFDCTAGKDERMHLHVIAPEQLPAILD